METKIDIKKMYNTNEVAEMLKTSPQVIRNLVYENKLKPCKQGRYCLFAESEILRYLESTLKPNKRTQQEEVQRVADQDYLTRRVSQNRINDKRYT